MPCKAYASPQIIVEPMSRHAVAALRWVNAEWQIKNRILEK
jgi:hypothetical protein